MKPTVHRAFLCLFTTLSFALAGCAANSVTLGPDLHIRDGHQETAPRIQEDGVNFIFPLSIADHQGQRMQVRAYNDLTNKVMGFSFAQPPDNHAHWDAFRVFIPDTRLRHMAPYLGFSMVVVAPDDLSHYVTSVRYGRSGLSPLKILWYAPRFQDDVTLPDGSRGLRIIVNLEIDGRQGQTLQSIATVGDTDFDEIITDQDSLIRIKGPKLDATYDPAIFTDIEFDIPYSRLAQLPPDMPLEITPALMINGQAQTGNVHIATFAGGTADDVRRKLQTIITGYDQKADQLQQEIDLLQQEAQP